VTLMERDRYKQGNLYDEDYFDKLDAITWKRRHNFFPKYQMQLLESLDARINDTILDVGCGTAWPIYHYASKCLFVIGIDLSKIGLNRALRKLKQFNRYTNVNLIIGNAEKIPVSDNSVNKILCVNLMEHLHQPTSFLREANRVLKKNGLIVIGTHNRWDLISRILQFIGYKAHKRVPLIGYADRTHRHLFSIHEITMLLYSCGFEVVKIMVQYSLLGMKLFGGDLVVNAKKTQRKAEGGSAR